MEQIKFNIIIPTRERADTLYWTIKTCLNQDYENYQIWVSDNCSNDNTEEIVKKINDPRIIYLKTPKRMSMSENWEFALNHIDDGYVMFLGADDAIMPNCLNTINSIISTDKLDAITWKSHFYWWPNIEINTRNSINIKLDYYYTILNAKKSLKKVAQNFDYTILPKIYYGFIKIEIVKKIKLKYGTFFFSAVPDVLSGVVIATEIDKYIYSYYPFTIAGVSGKSNGAAFYYGEENDGDNSLAKIFENENNIPYHPKLILSPNSAILTAEAYYQVYDRNKNVPQLSLRKVIKHALQNTNNYTIKKYNDEREIIEKIAIKNGERNFFLKICNKFPYNGYSTPMYEVNGYNPDYNCIHINAENFQIKNIYDVSIFINQFIKHFPIKSQFLPITEPIRKYFTRGYLHLLKKLITTFKKQ